ncbi:hypothetical protein Acor_80470 [Acrocarpospora corrugata]|uniref:Uncharacterized protein n=1 Tax=Acrocarpospora corrugata TaxID=35763 RepID=A0A5M3WI02_9ACTN|nr:hypothetical protein [Acrocarpospora corrugata]GES05978.1 hypothetical protein Acor_80470 [Acrocarpospora corrugata]
MFRLRLVVPPASPLIWVGFRPGVLRDLHDVEAGGAGAHGLARKDAALDLVGKAHALLETLSESAGIKPPSKRR